jgi:hypothetical protein
MLDLSLSAALLAVGIGDSASVAALIPASLASSTIKAALSAAGTTVAGVHRLSFSLGHANRHAEAIRVGEETLARRKAMLGPEHPDTLLTMTQLASRYWSANRLDAAIPMAEQALTAQRKLWGPAHNELPNSITNLGTSAATP